MRASASALRLVVPLLLGLFLVPVSVTAGPVPANIVANLEYLGGPPGSQVFRFDYTVENLGVDPDLAGLVIFFDSDGLARSDFQSLTYPEGWDDWFVLPEAPDSSWNVEWNTFSNAIPLGGSLSGFSVTFVWNDPYSIPGAQNYEVWNGGAHEGGTTIIPGVSIQGCLQGTVLMTCGGQTVPAGNIIVDLYTIDNILLATTVTDASGHYYFGGLFIDGHKVTIVTPMGYVADQETKTTSVFIGDCAVLDFELSCLQITPSQRTIGYWKHQVNCHIRGKGHPQESLANMSSYMEEIRIHFNENVLNPVKLVEVDPTTDSLIALQQLLTVNKDGTIKDRAKQQMVALLLNVVSLKLSQAEVISEDGANVSQAITYCWDLMTDGIISNDEDAKTIAGLINNGIMVPAGIIPLGTPVIWYERDSRGSIVYLGKGYPNPFVTSARIAFALKGDGFVPVDLKVFDVTGRVVRTLISGDLTPGQHSVSWNGMSDRGERVSSGVYFYELRTPTGAATGKLIVLKR
ncbi:MAG: T9SS type A sorting domain-containing protein [Candidatus Eiseniibacteriota bacterium]|nr:MAG: T9SS type A sorting domain-containing protein [Candidatus Eisenbacteria bacterium]